MVGVQETGLTAGRMPDPRLQPSGWPTRQGSHPPLTHRCLLHSPTHLSCRDSVVGSPAAQQMIDDARRVLPSTWCGREHGRQKCLYTKTGLLTAVRECWLGSGEKG